AEVGEGSGQPTDPQHTSTSAQLSNEEQFAVLSSSQLKKTHKPRKAKRTTKISQSSGPIHLDADETIYKEWKDRMERAATTASSLEVDQDSGNINRTQSMATLNESIPQGTGSGSGPRLNLLLPVLVSRHTLTAVRHKLMLPGITYYCLFWATAKAMTVNGERQIQALVDKKKVIITKKSVRSDLMLEDAAGTECLPNAVIFEQLTLMGAKTTTWNEFSSTMASAIICLATNQKFNFSKYIFDNMVKNLKGGVKFLMYPRFVQVFLDKQVEGISKHKGVYVTPSHTKNMFAKMKRPRKDFSSKVTPLFETMLVQAQEDMVEEEEGGWICFLGGNNFSRTKKYQGSNSSDGGNTGDGVKITGVVIGSGSGIGAEVEHSEPGFELIAWKRELIEQRIVAIVGYRKKMWGGLCCEVYGADVVVYGGRIGDVEVVSEEEEFEEEEEDPQEEEDDMEVDIEEDENEPELTCPYEETDSLNPPPPASESEPDNEIEVENPIEHEDETVPVSVYEVGESSTAAIPREDGDRLLPGFMRRDIDSLFGRMVNFSRRLCGRETAYALVEKKSEAKDKFYGKLILDLGNEVRSSVDQGTAAMERLVEKLGNVKEKAECKKLKKELEEAKLSNTFLRMQNERVERDLYWTRVRAHEFYQEMIRKGFMFEERPNEAIDVPIEDVKSSSLKESIMPPRSAPMTQAAMRRMIKESVDAAIAVDRERQTKVTNDASGSGPVRGQNTAPAVRECTFVGFIKCNPTVFHGIKGAIELHKWFEKT
ncbi:hypothetical protein Tco_0931208, partial [Tanacetum coccineum]